MHVWPLRQLLRCTKKLHRVVLAGLDLLCRHGCSHDAVGRDIGQAGHRMLGHQVNSALMRGKRAQLTVGPVLACRWWTMRTGC